MYIIAGLLKLLFKQFEHIKVDTNKIFLRHNTDIRALDNPIARIDANIVGEYLEQIVSKTNNRRIGLETGFIIPFTLTGTIFNIYRNCNKVKDIFTNLDILDPSANNITKYSTRIDNGLFYYEIEVSDEFSRKYPVGARQWNEMQYGISLQYAYSFYGAIP